MKLSRAFSRGRFLALFVLLSLLVPGAHGSSALASGPTLELPEAQTFATANTWFGVVPDGTTTVLAGFSGNVRAVLEVNQGGLRIKDSTFNSSTNVLTVPAVSVTVPFGYRTNTNFVGTGTGVTELALEGGIDEVNAVLLNLQFSGPTGSATLEVSVVKAAAGGNVAYDPASERYYEFINTSKTWQDARCAAKFESGRYNALSARYDKCDTSYLTPKTFNGLQGYLATVTSSTENSFVTSRAGSSQAWIGGSDEAVTRLNDSDTDIPRVEGQWRWSDGPEAGLVFWVAGCGTGATGDCSATGVSSTAKYNNWNGSEPNNAGSEGALQLLSGGTGKWNDLPVNSSTLPFIVEYGGLGGDTPDEQLETSVALNVAQNGPPTGVSGAPANGAVTVSWTSSTIVTGSLSGYTVTSTPGSFTCSTTSTSCVVSGLTNGTAYTFIVTASFAGGSPDRSSAASSAVTPVQGSSGSSSSAPSPSPTTPTVIAPTAQPRFAPQASPQPALQGPILRNNQPPAIPNQPTGLVNGVPTQVSTLVTDPNNLNIRTGVLNIGINVQQDQGLVRQGTNGETEVQVRKGGVTAFQGSGLAPRSFVQVFMPLQGTNAKELARIPVDETGAFNGEAVFQTGLQDAPLPIGRQVLQMVTVDEQGRQNVVEIAVNIVQPSPAPEINRENGQTPALLPGQSLATNGGVPEVVEVTVIPDQKQTVIAGDGWTMSIAPQDENSSVTENEDGEVLLELVRDESASVSGSGFMPNTRADVWLFSTPTLLGTVDIDENGEFNGTVEIDGQVIDVGEHTLQMQGVGMDGYVRAANLGVVVNDAEGAQSTEEAAGGFLWWWLAAAAILAALGVGGYAWWRRRSA